MTESQCAVFQFDVKTKLMSPGQTAPLIFNSRQEAEAYSREKIESTPGIGFQIYDRDGNILDTIADQQVYEKYHGQPAAKRSLLIGIACLFIGIALISLDVHFGFRLILGVFLGVRFLWVAAVRLIDGLASLHKRSTIKS